MKKYPKVVQCDKRGQIVIPKDIRQELGLDEGSAFWMYSITDEGILLKIIPKDNLEGSGSIKKIREKSRQVGVDERNVEKAVRQYKKKSSGRLEEV